MASTLSDLFNLGASAYNYFNQKGELQDQSKNLRNAYSGAADTIQRYQAPYQQAGLAALPKYTALGDFSFTPQDFQQNKSPGYDFRLSEGLKGVERSQAARGQYFSGATLASLNTRAQNEASQEYENAYNRALRTRQQNQGYYGDLVGMGAKQAQSIGENLASMELSRAGDLANIGGQKAQLLTTALSDVGLGGDQGALGTLASLADKASQKLFGTSLSDATDDMASKAISAAKQALGIGGGGAAALSGSADLLGQGVWGGMTGTIQDMGGGMVFDSATGSFFDMGTNTAAQGALTSGAPASSISSFLTSAPGLGLAAGALAFMMTGNLKQGIATGGLTAAGAALGSLAFPGVGTIIGGAIGGLASNFLGIGHTAKPDYGMRTSMTNEGFQDGLSVQGAWGWNGFSSADTRHLDNVKDYKKAFTAMSTVDTTLSGALTPEENAAVIKEMQRARTYKKEKNEGNLTDTKLMQRYIDNRRSMLKKVLGDARYNELHLGDFFKSFGTSISKAQQATAPKSKSTFGFQVGG